MLITDLSAHVAAPPVAGTGGAGALPGAAVCGAVSGRGGVGVPGPPRLLIASHTNVAVDRVLEGLQVRGCPPGLIPAVR